MVGDLGFGVVDSFASELPDQFLNAGISEQNMMGMAAGLADSGHLPFVYSIANFPTFRCLEQIRNDVVYHGLPVTIVSIGAGMGYGTLGYSHFGIEDFSILSSMPGLRIISPSDPTEVKAALSEILNKPMPTYLRLGKNGEESIHGSEVDISSGVLPIRKEGKFLILSTGSITSLAIKAADLIKATFGVDVAVYSVPIVKPLDISRIAFDSFEVVFTVEEHRLIGGFGSLVLQELNDLGLKNQIVRIGLGDETSFPVGTHQHLLSEKKLDVDGIFERIVTFTGLN
jgi:transketolase